MLSSRARQSILLRPRKQGSHANQENLEKEHQAEVARLEGLKKKSNEIDRHRAAFLFGTPQEKETLRQETRDVMELQLKEKEEKKKIDEEENIKMGEVIAHHVLVSSSIETEQDLQRKEYLRQLMVENQRLNELRSQLKGVQRQQEIEYETAEGGKFFEKWGRNTR